MDITAHENRLAGQVLEGNILEWVEANTQIGTIQRPYIWPGSWPDEDLVSMARSLPGWQFDSAWIYYEHWDEEIPAAVALFNQEQSRYHAVILRRDSVYAPPRDIIAVLDCGDAQQIILAMWLKLGER